MRHLFAASPSTINKFAKFLARLEEGDSLRRHFDLDSGFWIAPDAAPSLAQVEASEAADFNLVPGRKSPERAAPACARGSDTSSRRSMVLACVSSGPPKRARLGALFARRRALPGSGRRAIMGVGTA